jgi:CRISPR-associated protein Cas1
MAIKLAKEWLKASLSDLMNIEAISDNVFLTHIIAFHAQQAIEKSFKAMIENQNQKIPRVHSLRKLIELVDTKIEYDLELIKLLQSKIGTTQDINELMGIEGNIRKNYYDAFNLIINNFEMDGRSKQPPLNPINALISFGNMMCYSQVLRSLHQTQLNPTISYLHTPGERRYSLALDIAEIFKPIIGDNIIFWLVNNGEITAKSFKTNSGRIRFTNDAIKSIEKSIIKRMTEQTTIGEQRLTWRQVIRREVNRIKKNIVETSEYEPFING